jgi:hypothetical protein
VNQPIGMSKHVCVSFLVSRSCRRRNFEKDAKRLRRISAQSWSSASPTSTDYIFSIARAGIAQGFFIASVC